MAAPEPSSNPNTGYSIRTLPWKKILLGAAAILVALLLLFIARMWYLVAAAPDIDTITVSPEESATYICDEEGNYLRKLTLASSNRDIVTLAEIPDSLQNAIVAIEDERFYEHGGIDVKGILRAFWTGVSTGSFSEGASTITQQLIKNNVFTEWTQENSFMDRFSRKVQEQYLALQLEDRMSKEEILEHYLNTINLGSGCYGVQAASRRYFGKDVSELSLSESAVLAAIPQNPSGYNPIRYPEANRSRQTIILDYMEEQSYITAEEKRTASADNVYERILAYDESYEEEEAYTYYEDALIDQAMELLISEKGYSSEQAYRAVYSGGLRIFSAQDDGLQQICDEEFSNPANFPAGTEFGIDYALSVADESGLVTHYGSEALRSFVREQYDPSFDLLCVSQETAEKYAAAFRESIIKTGETYDAATGRDGSAEETVSENTEESNVQEQENNSENANNSNPQEEEADSENTNNSSPQEEEIDSENTRSSSSSAITLLGERLTLSPQPQASLVLMEQQSGLVRAIVGGRGEKTASLTLNRATSTTRQPGSTFKILTAYAPALDVSGQTLATLYDNEPFRYQDGTAVSNWDITDYTGPVTIREAITRSINVVAVRCITEITPRLGFDYARRFGITTLHETYSDHGNISSDIIQPLALGGITEGVTNLELCAAYASIAGGGVYRTPKFFTKILDRHGEVIFEYSEAGTSGSSSSGDSNADGSDQYSPSLSDSPVSFDSDSYGRDNVRILQESTAFLLTDAMRDVIDSPSGTAHGAISAAGQPVAGKTGTTSSYKDIWFTGYTPYYTCSVWGGYDNNASLPEGSTYHTYQKALWSAVMNRIHTGLPAADFPPPDFVTSVTLCRDSLLPAVPDGCPDTYEEFFAAGTEPAGECALHEPVPETEPIVIYPDILDQLLPETEALSESESDPGSESESGLESGDQETTESESLAESESGARPGTPEGGEAGSPGQSESGIGPENPEGGEAESPGQSESGSQAENLAGNESNSSDTTSDTNSLQDLMDRLMGAY